MHYYQLEVLLFDFLLPSRYRSTWDRMHCIDISSLFVFFSSFHWVPLTYGHCSLFGTIAEQHFLGSGLVIGVKKTGRASV